MSNLYILKSNNLSLKYHFYALLIFSFYYFLSFFLFKEIVINSHDNLDNVVVYNHIISRMINGEIDSYKSFLGGEFKWFYLDKIFYPINLFNLIFNDKIFYFVFEIIKKISSYLSFFLFSKFFLKDKKSAFFASILYATIVHLSFANYSPTIFLSFMPYIFYLILFKKNFSLKHYLIIFFIGLNSSLIFDYLAFITGLILCFFLKDDKNILKNYFAIIFTISTAILISSIPLFLTIFEQPMHRLEFTKEHLFGSFKKEIVFLYNFFSIQNLFDIFLLPLNFLKVCIIFSFILINDKRVYYVTFFIFILFLLRVILQSSLIDNFFEITFKFLKGFNFSRIANLMPFLLSLLVGLIMTFSKRLYYKKFFQIIIISSCLMLQFYLPCTEYVKEFLKINLKEEYLDNVKEDYNSKNYKSLLSKIFKLNNFKLNKINFDLKARSSFDNYYKFDQYEKIKNTVEESRIASLGIDPMIAAMNNINIIDGYYNIYPLFYKKKFRLIIEEELNQNNFLKDYYDNWGNRIYLFYTNKKNLLIRFNEAKNLGAKYIVSSFEVINDKLELIYILEESDSTIYLYKII